MALFDKKPKENVQPVSNAPKASKVTAGGKDISGLHPVRTREWYQGKLKQLNEKANKFETNGKKAIEKAAALRHRIGNMQKTMEKKIKAGLI
jgi:hypothetical protein